MTFFQVGFSNQGETVMKHFKYNTPEYWKAYARGLISQKQAEEDTVRYKERSQRSLCSCHRTSATHFCKERYPKPETRAYTPETRASVDEDRNLNANADKTVRFLMRHAYQKARETRIIRITVSYIAKVLKRACRTIQRHIRSLEEEGYIKVEVISSSVTGMVACLEITLLSPLFPDHHKEKWPHKLENPRNSDTTFLSDKQSLIIYSRKENRDSWAIRCMNGVYKALMKTKLFLNRTDPYPI